MSGTRAEIARAEAEAAAARARVDQTLARLKNRLSPSVRVHELWDGIRGRSEVAADDALELAYERPRMIAGIAAGVVLLLLRRPLARLLSGMFVRKPKWDVDDDMGKSVRQRQATPNGRRQK